MKPWEKQNINKNSDEPVTTLKEIIDIAGAITNPRTRCLFVLLYLSGARISELVRKDGYDVIQIEANKLERIYKYKKIRNKEKDRTGIKKRNITFEEKNGRPIMLIFLRNQKNRVRKTKEIPIPLDRPENEILVKFIMNWYGQVGDDEEMFDFGYQYAYRLLKPYFNPHWFRHLRATHLTTKYDLPTPLLKNYMGWSDERPSKFYQELRWGDLLEKL